MPKIGWRWGPAPLGGGVADPRKQAPTHVCYQYHTKFRRYRSNRLGVGRVIENFWGRWDPASLGWEYGWPLSHLSYPVKFCHCRSNHTCVINGDPPEKFDPSPPAFQGHSRSSEPTRIDNDFSIAIHSNHGPISYCFWDKRRFRSRIAKFSHPRVFNTPMRGSAWKFVTAVRAKSSVMPLPDGGRGLTMCAFV